MIDQSAELFRNPGEGVAAAWVSRATDGAGHIHACGGFRREGAHSAALPDDCEATRGHFAGTRTLFGDTRTPNAGTRTRIGGTRTANAGTRTRFGGTRVRNAGTRTHHAGTRSHIRETTWILRTDSAIWDLF